MAAPAAGTAYGIPYITLANISAASNASGGAFTVTFDTDQPCICALDYYPSDGRITTAPTNSGTVTDSSAVNRHSLTVTFSDARNAGQNFGFRIRLDTSDTSALTFRTYTGSLRLNGSRTTGKGNALPVRWNMFGDGTRPANGGGTGPLLNGPSSGNWSSYTWAQYNPKGTSFPTP